MSDATELKCKCGKPYSTTPICVHCGVIPVAEMSFDELKAQLAEKQAKIEELEGTIQSAYRLIIEHHNSSRPIQAGCFCPHCTKDGEENPVFTEIAGQALKGVYLI